MLWIEAVRELTKRLAEGKGAEAAAKRLFARLDDADLRELVVELMVIEARSLLRSETRVVEVEASALPEARSSRAVPLDETPEDRKARLAGARDDRERRKRLAEDVANGRTFEGHMR